MQISLILLFIFQYFHVVQLNDREKHFIKRAVHSSSLQNLNRYTKTYEIGQNIIINTPNFTFIDNLLSTVSANRLKPTVREHTSWLIRQISLNNIHSNQYREIARYDLIENRFILSHHEDSSYTIDANTGQLTLINTTDENLLYTEISLHAESGLSNGDEILHDIYRLIRLSNSSINCTTNLTINIDESVDITCTIEYEFFNYDDLNDYQPIINMTFYLKQNDSTYMPVDQIYLNEIKDLQIDNNWTRSITYTIRPINNEEYICMIIPDSLGNKDLFEDNNRQCRTTINIKNDNSSTVIFTRLNQWDLIDIFIIILIVVSSVLFLISLILCCIAQQYNKKRLVQIKPENKRMTLPINTKQTFTNNNEIPLNTSQQLSEPSIKTLSSKHKPGCPKYIPSDEYNLLSNDLFTHTTIDNIKKIILPDIPQNNDLFDDQTYIHFYIPSKTENRSIKKLHSSLFDKEKYSD